MNEDQFMGGDSFEEERVQDTRRPQKGRGKGGMIALILALVVVVGLLVFFFQRNSGPVAIVNGQEISRADYNKRVKLVENEWQASVSQGSETRPTESSEAQAIIKRTAIEGLVQEEIILGAARGAGMVISESEVSEALSNYRSLHESEESYLAELSSAGINEADLRDIIRKELLVNNYVEYMVPVESRAVTDTEIQEFYEGNREFLDESMTLEEFDEEYREALEFQKMQMAFGSIVETLQNQANVRILINLPEVPAPIVMPEVVSPPTNSASESEEVGTEAVENEAEIEEGVGVEAE